MLFTTSINMAATLVAYVTVSCHLQRVLPRVACCATASGAASLSCEGLQKVRLPHVACCATASAPPLRLHWRHRTAPVLANLAPTWEALQEQLLATPTGRQLQADAEQRAIGSGPPHTDASLRLFDAEDEADVRVTLYRDDSAWCPYCQKVWMLLEEKRIPHRVTKVPMNAYGDKPAWFTRKVDGGKLPAIELDGELHVESMVIMELLDDAYPQRPSMRPVAGSAEDERASALLFLERELQRDWFSLVFYPVEGEELVQADARLRATLDRVDDALAASPGPWFLGGAAPSLVDLQFVTHMERIVASVFYWKGLDLRGADGHWQHIERWLVAFEERPAYLATKSDFYTHAMDLPPQNGPGYSVEAAAAAAAQVDGFDGAWSLPIELGSGAEKLPPLQAATGEEGARHEAAFELIMNYANVVQFAARGASEPGKPAFHAELADPNAEPNVDFLLPVDVALRHVAAALLDGTGAAVKAARADLEGSGGDGELAEGWEAYEASGRIYYWNDVTGETMWTPPTRQLDACLAYLRDRVGVPRDMSQPAAMMLRAHLNWAIGLL